MNKLIKLDFVPFSTDLGLLALRAWFGLSLFGIHGLAKLKAFGPTITYFQEKMGFPAPLSSAAILAESVFALLLVLGVGTRWAALFIAVTMSVAFFKVHGAVLEQGNPGSGELAFLYLGGAIALLIAGAGRYSVDAKLGSSSAS
ncbi:DoxX family protein [Roseimicrobium sp. ORNL1]|uniref:DoxX family protein n=1 Tax=Roseimicrobium sp. ORNL1 TaxID=2711231 RepID=UPI0013E1990C|nr:DoxX family protein [Roseimicrobium sp. ORNL1]QIF03555.1 DoxX family protein [Roseimicrobium sp. ORNL1]